MTAGRPQRKQPGTIIAALAGLLFVFAAGFPAPRAATTERIVVDRFTGLAISGYDPVAFFIEGKPVLGDPDIELAYGGAIWRFCNPGNRDAFAANPEVYAPRFGGYDPVGVARGVAVAGNPNLWAISGGRLFLFYDSERLAAFAADRDRKSVV